MDRESEFGDGCGMGQGPEMSQEPGRRDDESGSASESQDLSGNSGEDEEDEESDEDEISASSREAT